MPVKVISDGPTGTKRITCPRCTYVLEFTGEDVITHVDSDGDVYRHIVCPRPECAARDKRPCTISVKWP